MFFQCYNDDGSYLKYNEAIGTVYDDSFTNETWLALLQTSPFMTSYQPNGFNDIRFSLKGDGTGRYVEDAQAGLENTVVGEIHKLASQYTFSRDWSGVHYQDDGTCGMYLGQTVAIEKMQCFLKGLPSRSTPDLDNSVTFPTFNGKKVSVSADRIYCEGMGDVEPEDLYPQFIKDRLKSEEILSLPVN